MQYEVKEGQSVYDVALLLYGDATFAVKLVNDNPDLLSLDNLDIAYIVVSYDETIKPTIKPFLIIDGSVISDKKPSYIIPNSQSIYDLAIMYGYGIENIVQFIQDTPQLLNIDNTDIAGIDILVTKKSTNLSNYISLQNKVLATNSSLSASDGFLLLQNGGYILLQNGYKIIL